MRLLLLVTAGAVIAVFSPAWGQEKSPPLPQERFVGDWVNVSDTVFTAKRLTISKAENAWFVETFVPIIAIKDGAAKQQDVSMGKTALRLVGDSPDAKALPYAFLIRDLKVTVQYSTLRIEKDELIVETFTIFGANARQSNYRSLEKFKRK